MVYAVLVILVILVIFTETVILLRHFLCYCSFLNRLSNTLQ